MIAGQSSANASALAGRERPVLRCAVGRRLFRLGGGAGASRDLRRGIGTGGLTRILLSESEQKARLKDVLESNSQGGDVLLALGPEGGWTGAELELFREAGWSTASLGNMILRAETAVIAAAAIVFAELR